MTRTKKPKLLPISIRQGKHLVQFTNRKDFYRFRDWLIEREKLARVVYFKADKGVGKPEKQWPELLLRNLKMGRQN